MTHICMRVTGVGTQGAYAGDTSSPSAVKCGSASYRFENLNTQQLDSEPYIISCGGISGGFVTLKQTGELRYLTVAEMYVYE